MGSNRSELDPAQRQVRPSLRVLFSSASNFDLSSHSGLAMAITSETTMLKQAALALCLTLAVTREVSAGPDIVDVST